MPGSPLCIPKLNCTDDDLIKAPDPLSTCKQDSNGVFTRDLKPEYVTVSSKYYTYQIHLIFMTLEQ